MATINLEFPKSAVLHLSLVRFQGKPRPCLDLDAWKVIGIAATDGTSSPQLWLVQQPVSVAGQTFAGRPDRGQIQSGLKKAKITCSVRPEGILGTPGNGRKLLSYKSGTPFFAQGDAADAVFYILKGKVKLTVTSPQGKEAVLAILDSGQFFGEGCMTAQTTRLMSATAATDGEAIRIACATALRAVRSEPLFADAFIEYLLARTVRVEADLVDQLFNSSERRLARALLLLANFGNDGGPEHVIANVSQETLAELIGTTRSRVSFFMNKFRKLGLISYNGDLQVHRSLLNLVLHEEPGIRA